ncbi:unnamed protein product [Angiostrongylus costaricensis]|uniref:Uncharacterized protein n=1 Tax=Angiostrongylus costaricensis TaxID=334426 RepID=A0A0R3PAB0_ANGCS|nr:unnamed protein product [Angiostrongylus costaricensis]
MKFLKKTTILKQQSKRQTENSESFVDDECEENEPNAKGAGIRTLDVITGDVKLKKKSYELSTSLSWDEVAHTCSDLR